MRTAIGRDVFRTASQPAGRERDKVLAYELVSLRNVEHTGFNSNRHKYGGHNKALVLMCAT